MHLCLFKDVVQIALRDVHEVAILVVGNRAVDLRRLIAIAIGLVKQIGLFRLKAALEHTVPDHFVQPAECALIISARPYLP